MVTRRCFPSPVRRTCTGSAGEDPTSTACTGTLESSARKPCGSALGMVRWNVAFTPKRRTSFPRADVAVVWSQQTKRPIGCRPSRQGPEALRRRMAALACRETRRRPLKQSRRIVDDSQVRGRRHTLTLPAAGSHPAHSGRSEQSDLVIGDDFTESIRAAVASDLAEKC